MLMHCCSISPESRANLLLGSCGYCTRTDDLGQKKRPKDHAFRRMVTTPLVGDAAPAPCSLLQRQAGRSYTGLFMRMPTDTLLSTADTALRTLFAAPRASRPCPTLPDQPTTLDGAEKRLSGALMRVNHVGEVCAQALYTGQALATRDPALRSQLEQASREETDHLAWTAERLQELGDRPSWLNPLWYAGAFTLGYVAGRIGDRASLGFVVETEHQVAAHLGSHLERLPARDHASRAIVAQMRDDELRHAREAAQAGGLPLPAPARQLMRMAAKVMTTTAHRI